MSDSRDFKGVWIPKEIWLNTELSALDKIIYAEIDSLDGENGCTASNEYLATFCDCSVTKVSLAISKLIEMGFIYVESFNGRRRVLKSRLLKIKRQTFKNSKADFENLNAINIDINIKKKNNSYIAPSKEEIEKYCAEKGYKIDVEYFIRYYTEGNDGVWRFKDGKPVKNWKQALVTWAYRDKPKQTPLKQTVATKKDAWERTADGGFVL